MEQDTIPEGSRLVLWHPLPKVLVWGNRRTVVYDWELCQMFIKQWRAQGMTREEVLELLFS